jgi:hypothetical protein
MYAQQYPNPTRTVTGTISVNNDDVVLACDTSTLAVTLNLGQIAQGYWNTNWKLYVYDSSNNASVNNITINAGSGQKINNANSITINTNGGAYLISVLNNTSFIGNFNGASGGAISQAYQTIQNKGVALTQRSTLNFKNNFLVTASDNSGASKTEVVIENQSLYAILNMTNPATNYVPINGTKLGSPYSILSGTTITNYSSNVGNITGFNNTTGIWTVPITGVYNITANLIVRLDANDVEAIVNLSGNGWTVNPELASMSIGVIRTPFLSATQEVVHANKQAATYKNSDINITSCALASLSANDEVYLKALNKTDIDVFGFAASPTIETMRIELGITRIS